MQRLGDIIKGYVDNWSLSGARAVTMDSNLETDLSMDSLDIVELSIKFEDVYEIEISDNEIDSWVIVRDIAATLRKHKVGEEYLIS